LQTLIEANSFTAWYDAREDRLHLAANMSVPDARADFWITRRFFLSLVMEAEAFLEDKVGSVPVDEINKVLEEKSLQDTTSNKQNSSNKTKEQDLPLNRVNVSLLDTLNLSWLKESQVIKLTMSSELYVVESYLKPQEMMAFLQMLIKQAPIMEWGATSVLFRR